MSVKRAIPTDMNYYKRLPLLILMVFLSKCVPVTPTSGVNYTSLTYSNKDYSSYIGMVRLFPESSNENASLENPVIALGRESLHLEFDLLEENYRNLNVRYIHCNVDWTPSDLTSIQFLNDYNEFPVNQYQYSENTQIPYVNYSVTLPSPTKSGNYLLVIYKDNDPRDILITRRFLVFEQKTEMDVQVLQSSLVSKRRVNQELQFGIRYEGLDQVNPLRDFQVVILQNHNWATQLKGLQPTLIREDQGYLEYDHFNGENNFPALKEFRFFDMRSVDFRGMNVAGVRKDTHPIRAYLTPDRSRYHQAYTQINNDLNGNYFLQNTDPNDSPLQSEYVEVHFELISEPISSGEVYVSGQLTNWNFLASNHMEYDQETRSYKGRLLLRQGYYNYLYWVYSENEPADLLEGSSFQTSNQYEILFYYRNAFNNFDELIGYKSFQAEIN